MTFCKWAVKRGIVARSPFEGVKMLKVRLDEQPAPPVLDADQVARLFATCTPDKEPGVWTAWTNTRDAAMLALFLDTGIRLTELLSMTVADAERAVRLSAFDVEGKGRRGRNIPVRDSCDWLTSYLDTRSTHPDAKDTDALWLSTHGGAIRWETAVQKMVRERCAKARIRFDQPGVKATAHTHALRHTAFHVMISSPTEGGKGMSVHEAARVMGWTPQTAYERADRYARAQANARAHAAFRKHRGIVPARRRPRIGR